MKRRLNEILLAAIILLSVIYLLFAFVFPKAPKVPTYTSASGALTAHFIDVGQGDSILLTCGGQSALIDSGTADYADTVISYLKNHGVSRLNLAVATHPHSDHIGAMSKILGAFPADKFLLPNAVNNTTSFETLLNTLNQKKIPTEYAQKGSHYTIGEASLTVLSPPKNFVTDDLNNYSLVFLVEYQGVRLLLCGDAQKEMEQKMIDDGLQAVDILKVGHHGSDTASSKKFLDVAAPIAAVISVGEGNPYGHPSQNVLSRLTDIGTKVYRTDQQGNIVITVQGGDFHVDTGR